MKFSFAHINTATIGAWVHLSRKERILTAVALLAAALIVGLAGDMYYFFRYVGNEHVSIIDMPTSNTMLTDKDIDEVIHFLEAREAGFQKILRSSPR